MDKSGQEKKLMFPVRYGRANFPQDANQILDEAEARAQRIDQDDILLVSHEVAEILRLSFTTVERMMRVGEIPGFKVGGHWRCSRKLLRKWIEEQSIG